MADDKIDIHSFKYKSFIFTSQNIDIDYYVIIGYSSTEYYDPKKSIVLQMEPWVYDNSKEWGVKCWGKWSNPSKQEFMHVHRHVDYLNPAQWFLQTPKTINLIRKNKVIAIISSKYIDTGHINRIDFIRYVESLGHDIIDVYGYQNYHNLKSYKGTIPNKIIIQDYKYMLSAENNNEYNYATEKIWEAFITGTLCFYDGCPNLSDYVSSMSYVPVSLCNYSDTLQIILHAMNNDLWSQKLSYILEARKLTIEKYNIFEIVSGIINI